MIKSLKVTVLPKAYKSTALYSRVCGSYDNSGKVPVL